MKTLWCSSFVLIGLLIGAAGCSSAGETEVAERREGLTGAGGTATLKYSSEWAGGYCADVTVSNTGAAASKTWTVVLDLNQSVRTSSWNGTFTQSGTRIEVKPASHNAVLAPGASTSFGFCANTTGTNYRPSLISVAVSSGADATANAKLSSAYSTRDVFLVSDADWRRVVTTVPAAVWTESAGTTKKNPLLIFHDERKVTGISASSDFFRFSTPALGVELQVATTWLPLGVATPVRLSLINRTSGSKTFLGILNRRASELIVTSNELRVVNQSEQYALTQLDGSEFTLRAGETRTFTINVTLPSSFSGGFDAEAALRFVSEYGTGISNPRLHVFEALPSELRAALPAPWGVVQHTEARELWQSIREVVYVAEDYSLALAAAPYAALTNAPLLIKNYNDNLDLAGRSVTCVGITDIRCTETLSLDQLRRRYLQRTNTTKVILTRAERNIDVLDSPMIASPSSRGVARFFGASSLVAPILAAAKQELLLTTDAQTADTVDGAFDQLLTTFGLKPRYLTIVASPLEIQQTIPIQYAGQSLSVSVDGTKYGNLDNDSLGFADARTGRIYGLTSSDTSSYVARAIFHTDLPRPSRDRYLFIGQGAAGDTDDMAEAEAALFANRAETTARTYANPTLPADWANRTLVDDNSHGDIYGASIAAVDIPWLSSTVVLSSSCSTCAFQKLHSNVANFFCARLLRRGALGAIVSVDMNGFVWEGTRLNDVLSGDLGGVSKAQQNFDKARTKFHEDYVRGTFEYTYLAGDIQFLLGDPTVSMRSAGPVLPEPTSTITAVGNGLAIDVTAPSITLAGPDQLLFMEGVDDLLHAPDAIVFARVGPMAPGAPSNVSSLDVDPEKFGGIHLAATHNDLDGNYWYLMLARDLSANPVGVVTNNRFRINAN